MENCGLVRDSAMVTMESRRPQWPSLFSRPYWWSPYIGTVLRPSVHSVVCTECIVVKRCVLEQKLLLIAYRKSYEKSIGTKMYDLDFRLKVVSRWCQPLRDIRRWISRKPLEIEAWFQSTNNRKWTTENQMATWLVTSRDPRRWCEAVRSAILATYSLASCSNGDGDAPGWRQIVVSAWTGRPAVVIKLILRRNQNQLDDDEDDGVLRQIAEQSERVLR